MLIKIFSVPLLGILLSLSACSGGGDTAVNELGLCSFIGGTVTGSNPQSSCANCTLRDRERAADRDVSSFAAIITPVGQQTATVSATGDGTSYPAGSIAGAFTTLPDSSSTNNITITTLLNGVTQDTAVGPMITVTATNGRTEAASYLSLNTSRPFNGLSVRINGTSNTEYRLYEFCGNARL